MIKLRTNSYILLDLVLNYSNSVTGHFTIEHNVKWILISLSLFK